MAVYNSSQSGPFDVASTWGGAGVPGDGDTFNVSQGHIVAVTGDSRPTNGFENSNVYGKLHLQGSGCMLRMNGQLLIDSLNSNLYFTEGSSSAPYFLMDPGSILELRGTNADAHRLWINGEQRITVEILGTNPNPQTTLSADVPHSGNPEYIPVNDASNFRAGDWISVYMPERTGAGVGWPLQKSDEGRWIHDIDNNNIYTRQFVGPEATIVSSSSNKVVVNDASVFRKGYQIIFGTGSNRNVREITDIGYGSNTLTLSSNVSGSVVGETVYHCNMDKTHFSGDKVLRIASVTTQDSNAGSNTITVNNTNGFSVGDMILIQSNDTNYANTNTWDKICDYTITNINTSTNVITFTNGYTSSTQTTLHMNTKAGAFVLNASRDTQIRAPEGTTYGTDQRSFIYVQGGDNYYRRIKIKNVLINIGSYSDSNNYCCIGMRGGSSYDLANYGQYISEFDGIVIMPVYRTTSNTGYLWEQHYLNWRNNISYNANGTGFRWYGSGMGMFNNIALRCNGWGFSNENDYYNLDTAQYNYVSSCANGHNFNQMATCSSKTYSHNICKIITGYCLGPAYVYGSAYYHRWYFDAFLYLSAGSRTARIIFLDSYAGNSWDATNPNGAGTRYTYGVNTGFDGYSSFNMRVSYDSAIMTFICNNFKYNEILQATRDFTRIWKDNEKAWLTYPDVDTNDSTYYQGADNAFFLPAGATAFIVGRVKMVNPTATNYPYIVARLIGDSYGNGVYGIPGQSGYNAHNSPLVNRMHGFHAATRFTTACKTDYERQTVTIGPFKTDMMIKAGVGILSGTGGFGVYGWYEKDMEIIIDKAQGVPGNIESFNFLSTKMPIRYGTSADETKTIWGG